MGAVTRQAVLAEHLPRGHRPGTPDLIQERSMVPCRVATAPTPPR